MTEIDALAKSSGDYTKHLLGYLPTDAAYFLVSTGRYDFFRHTDAGFVLKKAADSAETFLSERHAA